MRLFGLLLICGGLLAHMGAVVLAGESDVTDVVVTDQGDGRFRFDVTVRHADEGWDHYADKWVVKGPDGTVYGERVLLHPHETEQPFTRSQTGIEIPDDAAETIQTFGDAVKFITEAS